MFCPRNCYISTEKFQKNIFTRERRTATMVNKLTTKLLLLLLLFFVYNTKEKFSANGISLEDFHNYMSEPELAYYFNTADKRSLPDYEVLYLPVREALQSESGGEEAEIEYEFKAFGKPVNLKLKRNTNLLADNFKTYLINGDDVPEILGEEKSCHFLHKDERITASVSACGKDSLQGLLFLENSTLEIHPLNERLQKLALTREALLENTVEFSSNSQTRRIPHIIKRAVFSSSFGHDELFPITENLLKRREIRSHSSLKRRSSSRLTLEIALFFDQPAYKIFAPYFKYDDVKLRDMILAYVNGVQALYHHPSLGTSLELVMVRLDIMKRQPSNMPHYEGERSKLLDSFCAYQNSLNTNDDSNPNHWDMGLYVSGLDFFAYENGKKSGVTMGLATVGGVCLNQYACIIAELGTTNVFGKPYPSAGFTSVYILAHEIGHNLGMHHDSVTNSCPKEGYIMSPSRGTNGETQWSSCSAQIMANLGWAKCLKDSGKPGKNMDHTVFQDTPGRTYTAKKQCEILLRDRDAIMSPNQNLDTICYNLQCKTPHRSGYYHAGPALDGTSCGWKKYCYGGECTSKVPPKPVQIIPGGWGPWKAGECLSECVENSKGHTRRRRLCNNPVPVNTDEGCEGPSYEVALCDDERTCSEFPRKSIETYASERCREFALLLKDLDPHGNGLQAPHEEGRVWMGCAIFCKKRDSGSFYTPRIELNDLGISPYFPDGTWCHREHGQDYFCLQHHCLPENFKISKDTLMKKGFEDDLPMLQNARPHSEFFPPGLEAYFSLNPDGKPMQTVLKPSLTIPPKEEDWETNDYIELPDSELNEIDGNN